jgi:hypothetical protein
VSVSVHPAAAQQHELLEEDFSDSIVQSLSHTKTQSLFAEALNEVAESMEYHCEWRYEMGAYQRTAACWNALRQDRVFALIRQEEDNDWYCWGWTGDTTNIDLTYCLDSMVEDLEPLSYEFRT